MSTKDCSLEALGSIYLQSASPEDWGSTGTYIVAGSSIDEVQTLLDDHVIKTQTMKGSPYAAEFKERLDDWESYLTGVQDVVDVWLKAGGKGVSGGKSLEMWAVSGRQRAETWRFGVVSSSGARFCPPETRAGAGRVAVSRAHLLVRGESASDA